eukprot:CAMPEP_0113940636 /NCGR_PEP_ID=MMETSP1339-20121228/6727_1 /TAXON_ID=94617 /ORGANISM="Fibrocapsa japonica" /LENGTH=168 /DNA_ID=CAMNT_0000944531 /DNA_START=89 /DNA_END=592 /DNA_ORIENTATION=+ /assembly_acc=CAM_ASM_000762
MEGLSITGMGGEQYAKQSTSIIASRGPSRGRDSARSKNSGSRPSSRNRGSRGSSRGSSAKQSAREDVLSFKAQFGDVEECKEVIASARKMSPQVANALQQRENRSRGAGQNSESSKPSSSQSGKPPKPTKCKRAKTWNLEVEKQFRLQENGWRDINEYVAAHGNPETW